MDKTINNKTYKINTPKDINKLIEIFYFLSKTFFLEDMNEGNRYIRMGDRYAEMLQQFKKDKEFIYFMEKDSTIISALYAKEDTKDKMTIGAIAIAKEYRGLGLGKKLMLKVESDCKKKNYKSINLGARLNAIDFYKGMGYFPILMVKVFDFESIDNVKKINANYKKFSIINDFEDISYGFVMFSVDEVNKEYPSYFDDRLDVSDTQYIFVKDL